MSHDKHDKKDLAEALLKAHIKFTIDQLHGESLHKWVEFHLDSLLTDAAKLTLDDVVTPQMIKDTAKTYAVDMQIAGGIPELVGDIARAIHAHDIHHHTRLEDLANNQTVYEVTDIVIGLRSLRERIVRGVVSSPTFTAFASDLLYNGITGYLSQGAVTRKIPGADSMMRFGKNMLSMASPGLEASLEDNLRRYIGKTIESTSEHSAASLLRSLEDEPFRELVLDVWSKLKPMKVSEWRDDIGSRDIEELFVAGYEYWLELRQTPFYLALIDTGIDVFFEKYGTVTLLELLNEVGVTREMMLEEALRYTTHVIPVLKRKRLLEAWIRRLLKDFYHSDAIAEVLAKHH
jgi:hypothetical protein